MCESGAVKWPVSPLPPTPSDLHVQEDWYFFFFLKILGKLFWILTISGLMFFFRVLKLLGRNRKIKRRGISIIALSIRIMSGTGIFNGDWPQLWE